MADETPQTPTPQSAPPPAPLRMFPEQLGFICLVCLIVGLWGGWWFRGRVDKPSGTRTAAESSSGEDSGGAMPPASGSSSSMTLDQARAMVASINDPQQLIELGNRHSDMNQPMLAIAAYEKALKSDSRNADVWTDLGVAYRNAGLHDEALKAFLQANRINPKHAQSLYNIGIVYRFDKHDNKAAIAAWEKFLELHPKDPMAAQVRKLLDDAKSGKPATPPTSAAANSSAPPSGNATPISGNMALQQLMRQISSSTMALAQALEQQDQAAAKFVAHDLSTDGAKLVTIAPDAKFRAFAQGYQQVAKTLAAAAAAGHLDTVGAQLGDLGAQCNACHKVYAPDQKM